MYNYPADYMLSSPFATFRSITEFISFCEEGHEHFLFTILANDLTQ